MPTAPVFNELIFDGEEKSVGTFSLQIELSNATRSLYSDYDYTCSFSNNINAGVANINVSFCGNYAGSTTYHFTIAKRNVLLNSADCWTGEDLVISDSYPYTSYNFSYDTTDHASQVLINRNQSFFNETYDFDDLFDVDYTYQIGTYKELEPGHGTLVWDDIETEDVFVNATHSNRLYQTIATLTMKDPNHTFTIDYYEKATIEIGVVVNPVVATYSDESFEGKEYDGTPYNAVYHLTASIGGENTALVEGSDYEVIYEQGYNSYVENAINYGSYTARINFVESNFVLNQDQWYLSFNITKKKVLLTDSSIITWPTLKRLVWSNNPIMTEDGEVKLQCGFEQDGVTPKYVEDIGSYNFEFPYNYGLSPTHIKLNALNFETGYYDDNTGEWVRADNEITSYGEVLNPFESFKINNVSYDVATLENLTRVNLLDKIQFTLKDDATFLYRYYFNNSDYFESASKVFTSEDGEVTIIAGTEKKTLLSNVTEVPSYDYPGDYWLFSYDAYNYRYDFITNYQDRGGRNDVIINKAIFKEMKFGSHIVKNDFQDFTNWSLFGKAFTQSVENGDIFTVIYADDYKSHYTASLIGYDENDSFVVDKALASIDNDQIVHNDTHTVDTTVTPVGKTFEISFRNVDSNETLSFTIQIVNS